MAGNADEPSEGLEGSLIWRAESRRPIDKVPLCPREAASRLSFVLVRGKRLPDDGW